MMTNEFVILDGKLKLTNIDGWVVDMMVWIGNLMNRYCAR